jgi:hypothetical protein
MELDRSLFIEWEQHPITKAIFNRLAEVHKSISDEMQDTHIIMSDNSGKKLAYLAGERSSIELVLNMTIEDIADESSKSTGI